MLQLENAKIISNKHVIGDFYVLTLKAPKIIKHARPGQFVNILIDQKHTDPLLRRPFSIYDTDNKKGELKILYFVKGKGTNILKTLTKGLTLSITGPQGNGFHVHEDHKNLLLVGGGFGVAPLSYLAKENRDKNIFVVIGGRTKNLILCEKDFKKLGAKVFITTDDGSYGEKGLVTKSVEKILKGHNWIPASAGMTDGDGMTGKMIDEIFTVGPLPMMKAVAEMTRKYKVPCQISVEERMACGGTGCCYGCVIKTKEGYKTVCCQGPVFSAEEIAW